MDASACATATFASKTHTHTHYAANNSACLRHDAKADTVEHCTQARNKATKGPRTAVRETRAHPSHALPFAPQPNQPSVNPIPQSPTPCPTPPPTLRCAARCVLFRFHQLHPPKLRAVSHSAAQPFPNTRSQQPHLFTWQYSKRISSATQRAYMYCDRARSLACVRVRFHPLHPSRLQATPQSAVNSFYTWQYSKRISSATQRAYMHRDRVCSHTSCPSCHLPYKGNGVFHGGPLAPPLPEGRTQARLRHLARAAKKI